MKKYTFLNLATDILEKSDKPLTTIEILEKSKKEGLFDKVGSNGLTPEKTLSAQLVSDIKKNENSKFIKVDRGLYFLKDKKIDKNINCDIDIESNEKNKFNERELHLLLSTFVNLDEHFKCYTKTIYHEKSKKDKKGYNKWLHPDIVGVYFPFEDYDDATLKIQSDFKQNTYKLYSFELKIDLNFSNLREYYFQAVSNSSWANEGYLVVLKMSKEECLIDELRRLNNAFGIGIIELNPENIYESEIILPAKEKVNLDWDTIDRLVCENNDFKDFINNILEDIKLKKIKSKYDRVKTDEEIREYSKEKGII
ncbi:HTH domain-containing protein [[Clostridium] colinum]|uniref:HTH domain-containing protein n=1 Tax=[Clostridium] colinum TaxID=36835 RepID=UPI0020241C4D|nr:HTH domain-containing protein [[Clostridium] colinum]